MDMFDHCLYFNTTALARVLERRWAKAFKPFGLTPSQAFMLRVVLGKPGLLQSELATAMVITRPTATRTLDGLQELGLVERRSTGVDGRESAIYATDLSVAMREQLNAASAHVTTHLKKEMGADNFNQAVNQARSVRTILT